MHYNAARLRPQPSLDTSTVPAFDDGLMETLCFCTSAIRPQSTFGPLGDTGSTVDWQLTHHFSCKVGRLAPASWQPCRPCSTNLQWCKCDSDLQLLPQDQVWPSPYTRTYLVMGNPTFRVVFPSLAWPCFPTFVSQVQSATEFRVLTSNNTSPLFSGDSWPCLATHMAFPCSGQFSAWVPSTQCPRSARTLRPTRDLPSSWGPLPLPHACALASSAFLFDRLVHSQLSLWDSSLELHPSCSFFFCVF